MLVQEQEEAISFGLLQERANVSCALVLAGELTPGRQREHTTHVGRNAVVTFQDRSASVSHEGDWRSLICSHEIGKREVS